MSRTVTSVPAAPALPAMPRQRIAGAAPATPWDGVPVTPPPVLRVRFDQLAAATVSAATGPGVAVSLPRDLLRTPFDGCVIDVPAARPVDYSALVGRGSAAVPTPRRARGSH